MNGMFSAHLYGLLPLAQAGQPQQGNMLLSLLPFLLLIGVMYFLMIRPQQKKQKEHVKMITALKPGDEVVTLGGIYGSIAGVDDRKNTIYLKVSNDVKIKMDRSAVARVLEESSEVAPK